MKNIVGPPNSVVKNPRGGIWITNDQGQVILDVDRGRAKPVSPGIGFGEKRDPTPEELELLDELYGEAQQPEEGGEEEEDQGDPQQQ